MPDAILKEKFYEQMLLIRLFEEKLEELFAKGLLFGTTHSCIGQEAVCVAVANSLESCDIVISNHRGHGHYLATQNDVDGLLAEIMGKKTGICSGRGGSQHLCNGNFYSNGITAGMTPVAVGMALAEKLKNSRSIVTLFIGEGALGEGVVYESMNMASLWKLPIVFLIENNCYAMSTRFSDSLAGELWRRGEAFQIPSHEIEVKDALETYHFIQPIINKVRQNNGPAFIVFNTYRHRGHSKNDDCCYRSKDEEAYWKSRDPFNTIASQLSSERKQAILQTCTQRIESATQLALEAPFPSLNGSAI